MSCFNYQNEGGYKFGVIILWESGQSIAGPRKTEVAKLNQLISGCHAKDMLFWETDSIFVLTQNEKRLWNCFLVIWIKYDRRDPLKILATGRKEQFKKTK